MKDLIDKLLGALPVYGRQMVALLSGPKAAIRQMDLESDSALQQALVFLAVSFGIAFIAQIPFLPERQDKELLFGVLAIQSALFFALNVAMTIVVWRVVGGKLNRRKVIAATCYFSGVSTIIFLAIFLVAAGAFKTLDPVTYQQVMTWNVIDLSSLRESGGYKLFVGLMGVGFLATSAWIICVWGTYRELMQLSKLRSSIALLLFFVLSPCLIAVQSLMGMTIANSRTTPAVPTELVGVWRETWRGNANGADRVDQLQFTFAPPRFKFLPTGYYEMTNKDNAINGKCLTVTTQHEEGQVAVQDTKIILIPDKRTQLSHDLCTGKTWESPTNLAKAEYQYKINQQPVGWVLCLTNRFGPLCLTPAQQ